MVPISTQSEHSSSIEDVRVTIINQLPLAADMLDCETTTHGLRVLSANGMHRGLPVYCCTVPATVCKFCMVISASEDIPVFPSNTSMTCLPQTFVNYSMHLTSILKFSSLPNRTVTASRPVITTL